MASLSAVIAVVLIVTWNGMGGDARYAPVSGDPYSDILNDPNFRPAKEKDPNMTIDQMITTSYGGLNTYMSDNFLDVGGEVTTELDMVLTQDQFQRMYMKQEKSGRSKRKATRPLVYRWTDKTIPYEFINSHFTVDEVYYIKAAMAKWQETTCLKFRPANRNDKNRIRFQNGRGCNSLLGMAGGTQPINLEARGCRYSGLYLHEVGHAIGLVHEHQLPDRDQYIYIVYDNVAPSMRIWFNKYSNEDVNQYGVPFEYSSVMHYGVTAFSKDGSSQTIHARDKSREAEIGRVYLKGLSFSDIKVVNKMYGCNDHCAADSNCQEPAYLDKNCGCVRPDDDTTTTTSKPGSCNNVWSDAECDGWARDGECNNNPVWMKENCKKSCKACEGTDKPDKSKCENMYGEQKCQGWADRGECEANPIWMKENCKKACKVCSDDNGGGGGGGGGGGVTCVDMNQYCDSWAKSGYCQSNWYTKENCKKSCNTCTASDDDDANEVADKEDDKKNTGARATLSQLLALVLAVTVTGSYL